MPDRQNISHGFGPYIDGESRTLILGSFPSVKSREAAFFYGHPQNRFYPVLERVFEDRIEENNISAKKAFLRRHHLALYDVIESCTITGSSDSSIRDVVPADILALLNAAPIERIFVNGKTAKKYYDKYLYTLCGQIAVCLPSTSPANAAWSLDRLTEAWKIVARPEIRYVDLTSNFYVNKDTRDGYLVWADPESLSIPASSSDADFPADPGAFDASTAHNSGVSSLSSLPLIRFHSFDNMSFVDASFTTRCGGVSRGILGSLNLGFSRGDAEENVRENFKRCSAAMGCSLEQMIATDQVHGTTILRAEEGMGLGTGLAPEGSIRNSARPADNADSPPDGPEKSVLRPSVTGVDGFWCDTPGLTLCASFADCVPVYLADPVGRRISLVHSGWKGTVGQIAGKAVRILEKQGSRASDIVAVIGPSISGAHYEVTSDVIAAFRGEEAVGADAWAGNSGPQGPSAAKNLMRGCEKTNGRKLVDIRQSDCPEARQCGDKSGFPLYSEAELSDIYIQTDAKHYHLDLWAAIYYTLVHAGVRPENIHFSGICTWENADILWSHRRSGGHRGNMNAFLKIR